MWLLREPDRTPHTVESIDHCLTTRKKERDRPDMLPIPPRAEKTAYASPPSAILCCKNSARLI